MPYGTFLWDLDDDPGGNVQHIAEHCITVREVEEVILQMMQDAAAR